MSAATAPALKAPITPPSDATIAVPSPGIVFKALNAGPSALVAPPAAIANRDVPAPNLATAVPAPLNPTFCNAPPTPPLTAPAAALPPFAN